MSISTDVQAPVNSVLPVLEREIRTASGLDAAPADDTGSHSTHKRFTPPRVRDVVPRDEIGTNSTPLQIWEGTVLDVDNGAGVMHVLLNAKMSAMPRHTADIELEWVSDQDRDLVSPGAVFYLTLFKRTKPSVENAQELRFRRRPAWLQTQIRKVERDATVLATKFKLLPKAE